MKRHEDVKGKSRRNKQCKDRSLMLMEVRINFRTSQLLLFYGCGFAFGTFEAGATLCTWVWAPRKEGGNPRRPGEATGSVLRTSQGCALGGLEKSP